MEALPSWPPVSMGTCRWWRPCWSTEPTSTTSSMWVCLKGASGGHLLVASAHIALQSKFWCWRWHLSRQGNKRVNWVSLFCVEITSSLFIFALLSLSYIWSISHTYTIKIFKNHEIHILFITSPAYGLAENQKKLSYCRVIWEEEHTKKGKIKLFGREVRLDNWQRCKLGSPPGRCFCLKRSIWECSWEFRLTIYVPDAAQKVTFCPGLVCQNRCFSMNSCFICIPFTQYQSQFTSSGHLEHHFSSLQVTIRES